MILNKLAEDSILGSLINNPQLLEKYDLQPELFGYFMNRAVYGTCLALKASTNLSSLNDKLTKNDDYVAAGGLEYLKKLIKVADEREFDNNIAVLREKAHLRKLENVNTEVNNLIFENPADLNFKLNEKKLEREKLEESYIHRNNQTLLHAGGVTDAYIRGIDARRNLGNKLLGVPTGFRKLDQLLSGLQKTHLNIAAGRVHMGKTMLATSITQNIIKRKLGTNIATFTMEMSSTEYMSRLIAGISMVEAESLKHSSLSVEQWYRVAYARKLLHESNIYIDDTAAINCTYIDDSLKHLNKNGALPELVIVDYLQIMTPEGKNSNREQEVASISRSLKRLAKKHNTSILAMAQLNRNTERATNNRPGLGDLRESDAIGADADVIMFVYREKYYNLNTDFGDISEFIVGKNRNGQTGTAYAMFLDKFTRFEDIQLAYN
jgi:replicative DNA helicase